MTQKSVWSFRIISPYSRHSSQFCSKLHLFITTGSSIHVSILCTSWLALHNRFCSSIILLRSATNDVWLIIGNNSFWSPPSNVFFFMRTMTMTITMSMTTTTTTMTTTTTKMLLILLVLLLMMNIMIIITFYKRFYYTL